MPATSRQVGTAKIRPDSRRPRRLPQASRTTKLTATRTPPRLQHVEGRGEGGQPAETLTATVRMWSMISADPAIEATSPPKLSRLTT